MRPRCRQDDGRHAQALDRLTSFLEDGRICLSNRAERALRGIALGRNSGQFRGSDRGGGRAAVMYGLIVSADTNEVDSHVAD
ncbi:hypothetical protein D4Q52_06770 [Rhodopseudomonas palustris]|uniref:Transposase IS66 central domain-containing protein n=1 Tax=Rhodopseudomonas palustris TaxID=1076 RepID=A0A418VJH3_RHOPL|nr:hypothetical protein D4Q52_06770 [Rhodopseudomonas palustris]